MATVPVYLFLGFLESGKTSFIQRTLLDNRFQDKQDKSFIVQCEEGEEEIDITDILGKAVIFNVEEKEDFNAKNLEKAFKNSKCDRVLLEYNGMWTINELMQNLPNNWQVCQVMLMVDMTTFDVYSNNMRSLVVDKLQITELVAFNRCEGEVDKERYHSLVRSLNRRADILFEYKNGKVEYDDIPDELPYDLEADEVVIKDEDFAVFYMDIMEEPEKYNGKVVKFKALAGKNPRLPTNSFISGRMCMTCCADDIQYIGFLSRYGDIAKIKNKTFYYITAKVKAEYNDVYDGVGPVLDITAASATSKPLEEIVYFR